MCLTCLRTSSIQYFSSLYLLFSYFDATSSPISASLQKILCFYLVIFIFNFFFLRRKKGLSLKRIPPQRRFMSLSSLVLGVFWYLVFSQLLLYAYLLRLVFLCFRCVLLSHVSVSPHNFPGQGRNIMTTAVHLLLVSLASL